MDAFEEEERFQKLCHFLSIYFLFGIIVAVKSISGIKVIGMHFCGHVFSVVTDMTSIC